GNWVGITPLWFNEGMAEFLERLEFQQNFARADAFSERIETLRSLARSGRLPDLRWLLTTERKDWDRIGNDIAYASAWSIVQFLIQNPKHQQLVSEYLNRMSQHRCQPFDHKAFFEERYQGGLVAFDEDWRRWLVRERPTAVHF
ncbi:MAG: DUF1570 domain-containing protein, partial [Thiohalocapsa sp.]